MFSTVTSAFFSISLMSSSPRGDLRSIASDFLLALNMLKYHGSSGAFPGSTRRAGSPVFGFSILTTSAPRKASASVHDGPASNWVRSSTRTPARQSPTAACACTIVSFIEQPSRSGVLSRMFRRTGHRFAPARYHTGGIPVAPAFGYHRRHAPVTMHVRLSRCDLCTAHATCDDHERPSLDRLRRASHGAGHQGAVPLPRRGVA